MELGLRVALRVLRRRRPAGTAELESPCPRPRRLGGVGHLLRQGQDRRHAVPDHRVQPARRCRPAAPERPRSAGAEPDRPGRGDDGPHRQARRGHRGPQWRPRKVDPPEDRRHGNPPGARRTGDGRRRHHRLPVDPPCSPQRAGQHGGARAQRVSHTDPRSPRRGRCARSRRSPTRSTAPTPRAPVRRGV